MAYDDRRYGRHEAASGEPTGGRSYSGSLDYRGESGFRTTTTADEGGYDRYDSGSLRDATHSGLPAVPVEEPAEVFEARPEPGHDRLAIHLVWEFLLLLAVAGLVYLLLGAQPDALRGATLSGLLVNAAGFGLLGLAAGVTLRAGAPNLAIGPVAAAAGAYFADRGGDGVIVPTIFVLGVAVLLGLVVALVVVALHVPGWAASLAGAAAVVVWLQLQPAVIPVAGGFDPTGQAAFLFAVVAAVGILGGLLGSIRPVREVVGQFRPVGDPAARRGGRAALLTAGAIVLSMTISVVAGVLLVAGAGVPAQGSVGVNWLTWTLVGLGVALFGGTSVFGRRGGVFGTILAVVGLVLFQQLQQVQDWRISLLATAATLVVLGLVVSRLMERFGGSASDAWPVGGEPAEPEIRTATPEGAAEAADSWSSALPARPAPMQPAPWEDDRWGR